MTMKNWFIGIFWFQNLREIWVESCQAGWCNQVFSVCFGNIGIVLYEENIKYNSRVYPTLLLILYRRELGSCLSRIGMNIGHWNYSGWTNLRKPWPRSGNDRSGASLPFKRQNIISNPATSLKLSFSRWNRNWQSHHPSNWPVGCYLLLNNP